MVIGPVAVVYNVSGLDNLQLKPATLAKIFAGKVTKWDDADDQGRQPGRQAPVDHDPDRAPLGRVGHHRQLHQVPRRKTAESRLDLRQRQGVEGPGRHRRGQGSDGVASRVKSADGTISYVEWSYAENAGLKMAKIGNGAGEFAALTAESAGKTIAGAKVEGQGDDLKMTIDYNTKEAGAYPIVLVTYEIVCSKGLAADKLTLVKGLLGYAASTEGQADLTELGYAPLPETVRTKVETAVKNLS